MGLKLDGISLSDVSTVKIRTIAAPEQQTQNSALTDQLVENPKDQDLLKEFAKVLNCRIQELTSVKIQ